MRILQVNKYLYPKGGTERVLFDTVERLTTAGHEVALFGMACADNIRTYPTWETPWIHIDAGGLRGLIAGVRSLYSRGPISDFERAISEFKPDVIHVHNIYHQLSFGLLRVAKRYNIPVVLTAHDYHLISPNYALFHNGNLYTRAIGRRAYRCTFDNCMGSASKSVGATIEYYLRSSNKKLNQLISHIIAPSRFMQQMLETYGIQIPITIIPNPIDLVASEPRTADVTYDLLFVGRLSKEKGIIEFLDALEQMNTSVRVAIVGDGPLFPEVAERVALNSAIDLLGRKDAAGVRAMMIQSGALVVPSLWYENCPMVVLEAAAVGCPVIGTDLGGLQEMILPSLQLPYNDTEKWGKLFDKYLALLSKKDLVTAVHDWNKTLVQTHTSDTYIKTLLDVYETVQA